MNITEKESNYSNIDCMNVREILSCINKEDSTIAETIYSVIPQIEQVVEKIIEKVKSGGRLFYIGSGTSGRLGIIDAAECPPTFGVDENMINGLIAGGDKAIRKAIEHVEDNYDAGWEDLLKHDLNQNDVVIGISASGKTPYVIGALQKCSQYGITTAAITNNHNTPLAQEASYAIEVITGAEFITGSTRMKAGTATKLILNMISTTLMIKLGRIKNNKMVDMQLVNNKLIDRGVRIIMGIKEISYDEAKELLLKLGSVRKVIENTTE